MRRIRVCAVVLSMVLAAGCAGATGSTPGPRTSDDAGLASQRAPLDATGALADPGFESGGTTIWTQCGTVNATVQTAIVHSGTYAMQAGSATSEPNGNAALCQTVTVPGGSPKLTMWTYEQTNETSTTYAYQEISLRSPSNTATVLKSLYKGDSTSGWTQRSYDVSAYAGQSVVIYLGVHGNGASGYDIGLWVDDLAWSGGTATPTPVPTATPTVTPAPTATPKPTATPTATPTAKPTATPSASPTPDADEHAVRVQRSAIPHRSERVRRRHDHRRSVRRHLRPVTQVLAAKKTSSGNHGYFYVQMPSGYQIEIVSNLDAMAEASTDQPPSTWPWVAVGDYVYVQGRYYYDSASSQGVDWTEDDTSGSWPHVGLRRRLQRVGSELLEVLVTNGRVPDPHDRQPSVSRGAGVNAGPRVHDPNHNSSSRPLNRRNACNGVPIFRTMRVPSFVFALVLVVSLGAPALASADRNRGAGRPALRPAQDELLGRARFDRRARRPGRRPSCGCTHAVAPGGAPRRRAA